MLNEKEIREAIKSLTPVNSITKDDTGFLTRKALDTALSVLSLVLASSGMVERKRFGKEYDENSNCDSNYVYGFNACHDEFSLAIAKKLMGVEKLLIKEYDKRGHYFQAEISNVAQAIQKLFLGGD